MLHLEKHTPLMEQGLKNIMSGNAVQAAEYAGRIASTARYAADRMASIEREAEDYASHGVHIVGKYVWSREAGSGLSHSTLGKEIAERYHWRYVCIRPSYRGDFLCIPKSAFKAGLGAEFTLIADGGAPHWSNMYSILEKRPVMLNQYNSWVQFCFTGEATNLLKRWYDSCYRNPDVMRAITKRGHTPHDYLA